MSALADVRGWLAGKKTYFFAGFLGAVAVYAWWTGAVDNTVSLAILVTAFGMAGLGAKSERYGKATMAALEQLKLATAESSPGGKQITRDELVAIAMAAARESGAGEATASSLAQAIATKMLGQVSGGGNEVQR